MNSFPETLEKLAWNDIMNLYLQRKAEDLIREEIRVRKEQKAWDDSHEGYSRLP